MFWPAAGAVARSTSSFDFTVSRSEGSGESTVPQFAHVCLPLSHSALSGQRKLLAPTTGLPAHRYPHLDGSGSHLYKARALVVFCRLLPHMMSHTCARPRNLHSEMGVLSPVWAGVCQDGKRVLLRCLNHRSIFYNLLRARRHRVYMRGGPRLRIYRSPADTS